MFTGLVQAITTVRSFDGDRLVLHAPDGWNVQDLKQGESIAVNGCCLTYLSGTGDLLFDVSAETRARTTLSSWQAGRTVNLERALLPTDRLGGHFVQGHVDATATLIEKGANNEWRFEVDEQFDPLMIDKGSISLDGVSLTIVNPEGGRFSVAFIPETLAKTSLSHLAEGDSLNVEFDVLAKHAQKLLANLR